MVQSSCLMKLIGSVILHLLAVCLSFNIFAFPSDFVSDECSDHLSFLKPVFYLWYEIVVIFVQHSALFLSTGHEFQICESRRSRGSLNSLLNPFSAPSSSFATHSSTQDLRNSSLSLLIYFCCICLTLEFRHLAAHGLQFGLFTPT